MGFLVLFMLLAVGSIVNAADTPSTTQATDDGKPVTIARAREYEFTSKINGLPYRIYVYFSPRADTGKPQPVIYVFDGNYYFASACDAMSMNELAGIVVGVGYPSDDPAEVTRRRSFDLSLPITDTDKKHGGGDAFLRVVDEEIKPLVASHYKTDPARQALFGHSLGGLMVLRQLFLNPQAYSIYTAASPSIWWHNRAILGDEPAFSKRASEGDLHIRLLITSATDEQYHGTDPALLEKAKNNGMVDNATNLEMRLSALNPKAFNVSRAIFPDETHRSGSIAALVRSLNFTFSEPR